MVASNTANSCELKLNLTKSQALQITKKFNKIIFVAYPFYKGFFKCRTWIFNLKMLCSVAHVQKRMSEGLLPSCRAGKAYKSTKTAMTEVWTILQVTFSAAQAQWLAFMVGGRVTCWRGWGDGCSSCDTPASCVCKELSCWEMEGCGCIPGTPVGD